MHTHTCKCGAQQQHDADLCRWPQPWLCPDCELETLPPEPMSLIEAARQALELAVEYRGIADAYAPDMDSKFAEFREIEDAIKRAER